MLQELQHLKQTKKVLSSKIASTQVVFLSPADV